LKAKKRRGRRAPLPVWKCERVMMHVKVEKNHSTVLFYSFNKAKIFKNVTPFRLEIIGCPDRYGDGNLKPCFLTSEVSEFRENL
jgi:hypothetical protein